MPWPHPFCMIFGLANGLKTSCPLAFERFFQHSDWGGEEWSSIINGKLEWMETSLLVAQYQAQKHQTNQFSNVVKETCRYMRAVYF